MPRKYVYVVMEIHRSKEEYVNEYGEWDYDYKRYLRDVFGTKQRAENFIAEYTEKYNNHYDNKKYYREFCIITKEIL